MSTRFFTLLSRATAIREAIEREQHLSSPNQIRLMRLKRLYLRLSANIQDLATKRLIAMASAPSLRPAFVFADVRSARGFRSEAHQ